MVVAKGQDLIALKIREIAEQNGIPLIEDKALARSLYDVVSVDSMIPPEFYRTIAEIIHLIQTQEEQLAHRKTRTTRMTVEAAKTHFRAVEKIIAESVVDVATELRLADVCDLMLFIRCEQTANIEDLVNSSTELYFKNGTLKYALVGRLQRPMGRLADHSARYGVPPRRGQRIFQIGAEPIARRRRRSSIYSSTRRVSTRTPGRRD